MIAGLMNDAKKNSGTLMLASDSIDASLENQNFDDLTVESDFSTEQQLLDPDSPPFFLPPPDDVPPVPEDITATLAASPQAGATTGPGATIQLFPSTDSTTQVSPNPTFTTQAPPTETGSTVQTFPTLLTNTDPVSFTASETTVVREQVTTTTVPTPTQFVTTLLDEVVTFIPPSDPPIFVTLVRGESKNWHTSKVPIESQIFATLVTAATTISPRRQLRLNDGEVNPKRKFFKKNPNRKTVENAKEEPVVESAADLAKRALNLEKALLLARGNRRLVSKDVGPTDVKVPVPKGWRVTEILHCKGKQKLRAASRPPRSPLYTC
ncbi:hypothetical protein OESDEN_02954 [Oesophagostomum dentatum]|uniref:Uncharacterized protein n=1 Tax=Oesophagostomum dentatum TaxID=61180 RepID=A0A0B1THR4_OESDE|nr:hypothetical protein OESDEN_02954 [Oesophagostomum dentatum]